MKAKNILVIGGGAFGSSLAALASNNSEQVILKVRSQKSYDQILKGENTDYLPGVRLPKKIRPALSWDEISTLVNGQIDLIISGLPTKAISSFYQQNKQEVIHYLKAGTPLVSLSKGMDSDLLKLPDEIIEEFFPEYLEQICYLSGPSFAFEILHEQVTLVSLAGRDRKKILHVCDLLQTDYFKLMPTYDIKGVLLGGALKNVLAIAGGILEGLGYNHNTRAAMITRGIKEMLRFGRVYNARPETFYGLSGMGDLILTSTGELSRNKQFGLEIAKGRSPEEIIQSQKSVVEGYKTAKALYKMSLKHEIRTPLFQAIYAILYEKISPQKAIQMLMDLPTKFEGDE